MLKRYILILNFLPNLKTIGIDEVLLLQREEQEVDGLVLEMCELDSKINFLQQEDVNLAQTRNIFSTAVKEAPHLFNILPANENIVENKSFRSALVELLQGRVGQPSICEEEAIVHLRTNENNFANVTVDELLLAELTMEKNEENRDQIQRYMDVKFIVLSSNIWQGMFFETRRACKDYRKRIVPTKMEPQMFINTNRRLWPTLDVKCIIE